MVVIKEDIRFSQRIEKYRITSVCGEERQVEILESRVAPVIRFLGVY